MHKIGYIYRTTNNPDGSTPAYGQIQSENYYDGTTVGAAISTLTVGEANPVNHIQAQRNPRRRRDTNVHLRYRRLSVPVAPISWATVRRKGYDS